MSNRQLARLIKNFKEIRQEWIDILVANPESQDAPRYILSINSKIELLQTFWTFDDDEEMDMP